MRPLNRRTMAGRSFSGLAPSEPVQNVTPFAGLSTSATRRSRARALVMIRGSPRSEEHTSELQSQSNLVCRLLLEKKKNNKHSAIDHKRPNVRRHTNHRDTREGHTNPHTKIDSNRVGDVETDQYSSDVACT